MKPKCKKCGRVLTSPESIARGMGPECAGGGSGTRRRVRSRGQGRSGRTYDAVGGGAPGQQSLSLFAGYTAPPLTPLSASQPASPLPITAPLPPAPLAATAAVVRSKRKTTRLAARDASRALRTQAFLARQPFSIGLPPKLFHYQPVEGGWRESVHDRLTTHERLEKYLLTYGYINPVPKLETA